MLNEPLSAILREIGIAAGAGSATTGMYAHVCFGCVNPLAREVVRAIARQFMPRLIRNILIEDFLPPRGHSHRVSDTRIFISNDLAPWLATRPPPTRSKGQGERPLTREFRTPLKIINESFAVERRMRLVVLVFGLVCCLAFGSRVSAETEDLAHAGPWDAFGGTDTGGHEVCGMSTSWDDGRSFLIKRYEGDSYLTAQIYDPAWRLEEGHVAVAFQMDDNTPWSANPSVEKGSKWIEFTIPTLRLPDFFKEFVDSQTLYLRMGDNNVRWKMDLSGTETVIQAFKSCLNTM